MKALSLAETIHSFRNSTAPSQILLPVGSSPDLVPGAMGVLLLKPSSGYLPQTTIAEIFDRLVLGHGHEVRSVAWWNGADLKARGLMAKHYPGFHRVAHGGLAALPAAVQEELRSFYAEPAGAFARQFGAAFDLSLFRTPYQLVDAGIAAETLNRLWELDRSAAANPLGQIHRVNDDAFSLALTLPSGPEIPAPLRGTTVVLLNGFFAKLEHDFEAKGCIAVWIQRRRSSTTSWEDLRQRYAGKTNPFQAPAGTIRGDAARGTLKVETVSILANVIHLSATEAEGQREVEQVWWDPALCAQVFPGSLTTG